MKEQHFDQRYYLKNLDENGIKMRYLKDETDRLTMVEMKRILVSQYMEVKIKTKRSI